MSESKMSRKKFDKEMKRLQVELCALQDWVVREGARIVVVFEGRDAAGKGGVIKRITERVSPRVFRVIALPAPTERQKSQMYAQRYLPHFPAAGEIVLFDRSWYNRAGVERVMGFCTDEEYYRFLRVTPAFEQNAIEEGIILIKYFLDVSSEEQEKRFRARAEDPLKHWKLSPMDIESWARWWDYTQAYEAMIAATDTPYAPWYRVHSNDKRAARLNCISHFLSMIPYEKTEYELGPVPERHPRGPDVPDEVKFKHTVPEPF
jgi:polyphosphate kinase 2